MSPEYAPWAIDSTGLAYPIALAMFGANWMEKQVNMDYKKKYEDAVNGVIKMVSALQKCGAISDDGYIMSNLREIFPQLRESEDEKIRTWLLRLINTAGYRELESDPIPGRGKVIDWLERQKTERYSPLCKTVKDKIREYVSNHFVTDTLVKTDVSSIVKAMEEGVRIGMEEDGQGRARRTGEDRDMAMKIKCYLSSAIGVPEDEMRAMEKWLDGE